MLHDERTKIDFHHLAGVTVWAKGRSSAATEQMKGLLFG